MSDFYTVTKSSSGGWVVVVNGRVVIGLGSYESAFATDIATILNDETAALRQRIAELEAENAKLKESPALPVAEEKPRLDKENPVTLQGKVYNLYPVVTAQNEVMVTFDLVKDDGGFSKIAVLPKSWAEHKSIIVSESAIEILAIPLLYTTRKQIQSDVDFIFQSLVSPAIPETIASGDTQEKFVQVNWSGRGFSSGSYKCVGNFARFEKFWTVIEIDRANKVSQMWIASDKCRLV